MRWRIRRGKAAVLARYTAGAVELSYRPLSEPSPVIRALGPPTPSGPRTPSSASETDEDRARGAIRFSLGRYNTAADRLLEVLPASVENLRKLAPARA